MAGHHRLTVSLRLWVYLCHVKSARVWRNTIHDFGPTNVKSIGTQAAFFIPKIKTFLECTERVFAYQRMHFS